MARMIPPTIHPDIKSGAEKRLFRLFNNAPGTENWVVLHSLGLTRHQTKRRGEIDFLILCPRGVFVLEVKGGRLSRENGIWETRDRFGEYHRLHESPYEQASSAMFALEKDIRAEFGQDHPLSRVILGYGVLLPDTSEMDIEFGTDGDRDLTYCLEDMRQPVTRYIGRLANFFLNKSSPRLKPPDSEGIGKLSVFLRGDFDLLPPLWSKVKETEEELLELTREQYLILDAMEGNPRIIVRGAAGTGKTELARREALTAARSGRRTVFLCYNRLLVAKLRTDPVLVKFEDNLRIYSVYQYMDELIRHSPFSEEFQVKRSAAESNHLYNNLYPEYASLAAMEVETAGWDMMVVDEGQDLASESILDFLGLCLAGGFESGNWRWFMDDNNQAAVYGVAETGSISRLEQFGSSHLLTVNCRNTRQIHEETRMLANPRVKAVARVEGLPVRYVWYSSSDNQVKLLEKQIRRILEGCVKPADVIILSAVAAAESAASELPDDEVWKFDEASVVKGEGNRQIGYCTVSAYKGLEADVVILTDITRLDSDWWQSVLYVGMSRAKVELIILLPENLKSIYNRKLRSMMEALSEED